MLIVGAGLTGLAVAQRLESRGCDDYLLVESECRPGGWAKTDWDGLYGSDRAVHALYFRDPAIRDLVDGLLSGRWVAHNKNCIVDSRGVRTPFPFHANLYGRPPEVVEECLLGLRHAWSHRDVSDTRPITFADWVDANYGFGVAKHFMEPYNTKMWTVPPSQMGHDWLGRFRSDVEPSRILAGALRPIDSDIGLNAKFFYPERGISEVSDALASGLSRAPRFSSRVVGVDVGQRLAWLDDGTGLKYETMISTVPLTTMAGLVGDLPGPVLSAASRLESMDLVLVDVGFADAPPSDVHWAYLPDPDILAYRLQLCHVFSPLLAPPGHGLYCLEIAHSRHRPLPATPIRDRVIADLVRSGWLRSPDVTFYRERRLPCAYVIPRVDAAADAELVRHHLGAHGIYSIGRYGKWTYSNMEDALIDGRAMADTLLAGEPVLV